MATDYLTVETAHDGYSYSLDCFGPGADSAEEETEKYFGTMMDVFDNPHTRLSRVPHLTTKTRQLRLLELFLGLVQALLGSLYGWAFTR